ncbi:4-(cytidine 5'-diphospho)-2-C-methyl-D-erythritol kinase [Yoonia litorea]|uniref:4-diphosphocytidyl-2-C-methyl-D-erythritol kinase n=1 Tax=Yoonia litorea TaxID=1123755 RepID=A0A1I6N2W4_9RHOB|nr:4-(cytidine 5'-diphospho)-2-C-methyl-D-erythritol kinase [Yoonia litorea]SFS22138.1 4-diphosphocytidyl-2-C-methyl-D-erythritol kinase [Yoonia litorea]
MTTARIAAPAKVNLTLHVTGQRADGYHLLDSLVVFADVGDVITVEAADDLTLTVDGPFGAGVPTDQSNLILRAAQVLAEARGVSQGARLHLEKNLPHAAGIGSGSSDAAATLSLLADLWQVDPLKADDPRVLELGADVPVCAAGPKPQRMRGIGEVLSSVPPLPEVALVLVRPPVAVPTGPVFQGLATKTGEPMTGVPEALDFPKFVNWLSRQRNDLQTPAIGIAPVIGQVIDVLQMQDGAALAAMSGSGATCFGAFATLSQAQDAASQIRSAHPDWWVEAARML